MNSLVPYRILFVIAMIGTTFGLSLPIAYSVFCRLNGAGVPAPVAVLAGVGAIVLVLAVWTAGCSLIAGLLKVLNVSPFRDVSFGVCIWHVHVRVLLILLLLGLLSGFWTFIIQRVQSHFAALNASDASSL